MFIAMDMGRLQVLEGAQVTVEAMVLLMDALTVLAEEDIITERLLVQEVISVQRLMLLHELQDILTQPAQRRRWEEVMADMARQEVIMVLQAMALAQLMVGLKDIIAQKLMLRPVLQVMLTLQLLLQLQVAVITAEDMVLTLMAVQHNMADMVLEVMVEQPKILMEAGHLRTEQLILEVILEEKEEVILVRVAILEVILEEKEVLILEVAQEAQQVVKAEAQEAQQVVKAEAQEE